MRKMGTRLLSKLIVGTYPAHLLTSIKREKSEVDHIPLLSRGRSGLPHLYQVKYR
jgi:hypothetical protein